jgi:hypothetical protein
MNLHISPCECGALKSALAGILYPLSFDEFSALQIWRPHRAP